MDRFLLRFPVFRLFLALVWRWGILLGFIFTLSSCNRPSTTGIASCTATQTEQWNFIQNAQMGVAGRDPVGARIGYFDVFEDRPGPWNTNWRPYWDYKETLCGELFDFDFNTTLGNEDDWNNYTIPRPEERFSTLLSDPLNVALELDSQFPMFTKPFSKNYHTCGTGANGETIYCMEAEITPTQEFFYNPWFQKGIVYPSEPDLTESILERQQICTYGPYVGDFRHGGRPEIHPSELYWFQNDFGGGVVTTLMVLHDDSERFNFPSEFGFHDTLNPPPDYWRAWAATPRTGEFNLAFEVTISSIENTGPPLQVDIREAPAPYGKQHVVTANNAMARSDATDGTDHELKYNGVTGLIVHELQSQDGDIGVQFTDVCTTGTDGNSTRLQGYITLTTMVGINDDGKEGFHVLQVQSYRGENTNAPISLTVPAVGIDGTIVPETIHPALVEGKTEIMADLQLALISSPEASESDRKIIKVEWVRGDQRRELLFLKLGASDRNNYTRQIITSIQRTLGFYDPQETGTPELQEPGPYELQGVIKDVPVFDGANIEITMESGMVLIESIPHMALAPDIIAETPLRAASDSNTWNSMVVLAGGNTEVSSEPPNQFKRVHRWQLDIAPLYAPMKNEEIYRDDDAPVSERLNELIIQGDPQRLEEFFGSRRPFSVEWVYEATNLITGESVIVNTEGNASANEVQVRHAASETILERLQVVFPQDPENGIFELVITAKMQDSLGNTAEIQHALWSHILTDQDSSKLVEQIIPTVAVLAGISPQELQAAEGREPPDNLTAQIFPDPKRRRAVMLRAIAMQAAADNFISLSELTSLISGARLFGSN